MIDLNRLEHIVVLQLENRSFDHVFGGMAREDATLDVDLEFTNFNHAGKLCPMLELDDELAGVFPDGPGHSSTSVDRQIAGGRMTGFVKDFQDCHPKNPRPEIVMHYLQRRHQPLGYFFAEHYTVLQRFFPSIATGTLPNRFYGLCGHSGGETDNRILRQLFLDLPHIFDLIPEQQWAVYSGAFPTIALVGGIGELVTYNDNFRRIKTFVEQAKAGTLPRLSWIEPVYSWSSNPVLRAFRIPEGVQNDDHPPSHTAHGQRLLFDVYGALLSNKAKWEKTLLIVNYDEHGGFADHVPPPRIPKEDVGKDGIEWMAPRVPCWLISPFAAKAGRNNLQFEHCSVLRFIADVFGVERLGRASSPNTRSIAEALLDEPREELCPPPPPPPPQPKSAHEIPDGDLGPVIANYLETLEREAPDRAEQLRDNLERRVRSVLPPHAPGRGLVITGIFVYEKSTIAFETSEPLALELMGAPIESATTLPASASLSPGVYRVVSKEKLVVKPVETTSVDVVEGNVQDDWPTPPARARDFLGVAFDQVTDFLEAARSYRPPMRRALVIGAQTHGLQGVETDAAAMRTFLANRGFAIDFRIGQDASRQGILAGYTRLIESSGEHDVAVIYYGGHGSKVSLADPSLGSWQHIVPFDYDQSTADNWCGITSRELSIHQKLLTDRCRNVTVILDCCHSAEMSRGPAVQDAVPRALPSPNETGFRNHLEALREAYPDAFAALNPTGNPYAVRLVACAQSESAYEYATSNGGYRGIFTEALIEVMEAVGSAPITWKALGEAVRARVVRAFPTQRPDIEGPARRRVFELVEEDEVGAAAIRFVADRYVLSAGRLTGVTERDVYAVMPVGSVVHDKTKELGRVEVVTVAAVTATAKRPVAGEPFPGDAVAIPVVRHAPRRTVTLEVPDEHRPAILQALAATRTMRAADPGEAGAVATLRLADNQLTIWDGKGALFEPATYSEPNLQAVVKNVANLGVAQAVRQLVGVAGVAAEEVTIELGVAEGGKLTPLPDRGAALGLADRIYIQATSHAQRRLYVHVFNIGVRGKVKLLTAFAGGGVALDSGATFRLAGNPGDTSGLGLVWPAGMLRDVPRIDEIVVIVTTQPAALSGLETSEYATRGARGPGSKLEALVAQLQDGLTRDTVGPEPIDGYYAKLLSFVLHPRDVAMGGLAFDIDENPTGMAGARSAAAWIAKGPAAALPGDVPGKVAIRLDDLVVLKNRALFRADVRIDAVICTRSEGTFDPDKPRKPETWTATFKRISDGERLSLEKPVLFHGPVQDFVDIALFVSRDTEGSLSLAELFEQQTNSSEFRAASAALLFAAGAVAATPWVAAVGASAVLARMAYRLVLGVRGESIGMYRTSFLAGERFGVGRHPVEGLYKAQDFAFSLSVVAV